MKSLQLIFWWSAFLLSFGNFTARVTAGQALLPRVANTTLRLPDRIPVVGYGLENAFPGLTFHHPVALAAPAAETNRLFVVERTGAIYVITNLAEPSKTLFLDLSHRIDASYGEGGLLGLAFHPDFASNRFFFAFSTMPGAEDRFHDVLLRFEASPDNPNEAVLNSEVAILAQIDDSNQHNGGDIKFGPDGYLYVSIGERVHRDIDWLDQTPVDRDLQGAILRIDVDGRPGNPRPNSHSASTEHYWIPADNPFLGITQYHGRAVSPAEVRTELFATGFRNPWRLAFDSLTGDLYVADVGDSQQEEVNLVMAGGDYGWPYYEGRMTRAFTQPPQFSHQPPWHIYEHGWSGGTNGDCIIGGLVYRGSGLPGLQGRYLFADFRSGYVWAAQRHAGDAIVERLVDSTIGLASFGTDPRDGEVLVTHLYDGTILRLVYRPPAVATNVPSTLADTGIFADLATLTPNAGIEPYEINVPFWSDHAIKSRWFSLPDIHQTIGYNPAGSWSFPTGAVWIKHFELELTNGLPASLRRLETRVLVNSSEGFYGLTYRWGDSTTNAWLVPAEGQVEHLTLRDQSGAILREQDWRYPSRADCMNCHTKWGGRVLGFNTPQLNRTVSGGVLGTNQILALGAAGYLMPPPLSPTELPALATAHDLGAPVEFRVRSYFQANCASCHVPGDADYANWDARFTTPLAEAGITSSGGVVVPGSLSESRLYHRLLGWPRRMPPIGTAVYDTNASDLVANWITNLPPAPWSYGSIGEVVHSGGSTVSNGVYRVGGTGLSLGSTNDGFQFIRRPFEHAAAQYIVRLGAQSAFNDWALAGLMLREGAGTSDRFVMAACRSDGRASMLQRAAPNPVTLPAWSGPVTLPHWLRLVRLGDEISAFRSHDGTNWVVLGGATWENPGALNIGLAVNSGSRTAFNNATFDELSYLSIVLTSSAPAELVQPANASLRATVEQLGRKVARVEFYDGAERIGDDLTAPYALALTNIWSGDHVFTARAVDEAGAVVVSQPWLLAVQTPSSLVTTPFEDSINKGNWPGHHGSRGYLIVNYRTNLPAFATVSLTGGSAVTWAANSKDRRALAREGSISRIAAAWRAPSSFTVSLKLLDGDLHSLSIYFLDWNTSNARLQRVEFIDSATGTVLTSHILSSFSGGVYLTSTIRGSVDVRLTSIAGPGPVLSGIFLDQDSNVLPAVELVRPREAESISLPSELFLEANALDQDGRVERVEFDLDGTLVGVANRSPFSVTITNLTEGTHIAVARAYDDLGDNSESFPVSFQAVLPRAKVAFLEKDVTTQGNWLGRYGSAGFLLPPVTNWWPEGFHFDIPGVEYYPQVSDDPNYLELPGQPGRIFPLVYSYEDVLYDLSLADGHPGRLALYFLDTAVYPQTVAVLDAATRQVLDSRTVTNGLGGCYLVWYAQGHVWLRITNPAGGTQARVSGLFFDPFTNAPPEVSLVRPSADLDVLTPARLLLSASATAPDGVRSVQFHTATSMVGESPRAPYEFLWEFPVAGSHQIFARAVSTAGAVADSPETTVRVSFATPPKVRFVQADTETGGDWRGVYGTEGYWLPSTLNYSNLPPAISVVNTQGWAEVYSDSPRALVAPNAPVRTSFLWFGDNPWQVQLRLNDGQVHRVSFYNYAAGLTNPVTITIRSADSETVFDVREISSQDIGNYLTWDIQGDVVIQVTAPAASTAFLNAIFLDPTPDGYSDWQRRHFTAAEQLNPGISGEPADPDSDAYDNWAEYLLRRDPRVVDIGGPLWFEREADSIFLHVLVAKTADANKVSVESSSDVQAWTNAVPVELFELQDRGDHVKRRYQLPLDRDQAVFYRLRVQPRS